MCQRILSAHTFCGRIVHFCSKNKTKEVKAVIYALDTIVSKSFRIYGSTEEEGYKSICIKCKQMFNLCE